jgi:predicted Zn-dependent protease
MTRPSASALLIDDSSAYFQRGLATGSQNDRTTALENLRRAEALDPKNPVILFNEAIVLKENGMVSNAIEIWNRYLTVEHNPQWRAEGQQRLQKLEQMQGVLHRQSNFLRALPVSSL